MFLQQASYTPSFGGLGIKENPKTCCIPVVMLTAKIDAASERECMNLRAVDYIKKPWGPRELEDRIGMALGFPTLNPPADLGPDESSGDDQEDCEARPGLDQIPELSPDQTTVNAEQKNFDVSDTDQMSRFRTRKFQVQPDGVDPASLI